ncbi:MAG: ECF transporter S component [Anaerolineae bacterium]|nr:ECF transporter S component [Anaerolineae bacterium]
MKIGGRRLSIGFDGLVLAVASLLGFAAFAYPFFTTTLAQGGVTGAAHAQDAPLMTIVLVLLCLGAVFAALNSTTPDRRINAKMVAILGVLTAANAVLRAVPGPAGFAAVFMLPILCGYVYGATFGFLLGALSLLVSALIGAGLGPWLPYQMLAVGWVGLTSAWLPNLQRLGKLEALILALWGFLWGLFFGAVMNIWFWPFVFQPQQAELHWEAGLGLREALARYAAFYAVTSLWWDLGRAGGNALLIALFGAPLLKLLRRFAKRFHFTLADRAQPVSEH